MVFDASQKGNWENIRNEAINGKPFRFKREILEAPLNVSRRLLRGTRCATSDELLYIAASLSLLEPVNYYPYVHGKISQNKYHLPVQASTCNTLNGRSGDLSG